MVKVQYKGREGVQIAATGQVVERGEVVDVDGDVAEGLLASGDWEKSTKAAGKAKEPESEPVDTSPVVAASVVEGEVDDDRKGDD